MNLTLNIVADINGHVVNCGQVTLSVPDELVMQMVPPPPAEPGPSIWASVEQAEPVVMVREERPLLEQSWVYSAHYQRYGKQVVDAVAALGRFRGTAAELTVRTGLKLEPRVVGPALHAALSAGELLGDVQPKRGSMPCVYDLWAPDVRPSETAPAVQPAVQKPVAEKGMVQAGWYQRHGHLVMEAMQREGRFQGTALKLKTVQGIPTDHSNVAAALCKALDTGHLLGTRSPKKRGSPTVYDVWVPGWGEAAAEPALAVASVAAELPYVAAVPAQPMTEAELREAVLKKFRKGQFFDGQDAEFFRAMVGREPAGNEMDSMRAVLKQLDRERFIDFGEIVREGAPALWEVFA